MSVKIFTITHKPFTPPKDPMYVPLHVGRAAAEDFGYLGDDTGDSISHLNPCFCELTGMYWLWKNYANTDFIGICHYRRYLINEKEELFTEKELNSLLQQYDLLTTKLLTLPGPYYQGFSVNHHEKDLLLTQKAIEQLYPQYLDTFQQLIHGPNTYFGNIFITSRKLYDQYCEWLFSILFAVQKEVDFTGYDNYQKRLFGFLAEFLQTVWIRCNRLKTYECKVGMIGEKYETRMLKEQLASLLEKRDYQGAKACFMAHYEKRPDILMEASDINGELRLCMQIISTCEFEDEAYGSCILDIFRDYRSLTEFFSTLNIAVSNKLNGYARTEDIAFLEKNSAVTPLAVEIAASLLTV
ncbi:MAG: DUF4422 domain-containing protein [Lachnospiraceae bacterium]